MRNKKVGETMDKQKKVVGEYGAFGFINAGIALAFDGLHSFLTPKSAPWIVLYYAGYIIAVYLFYVLGVEAARFFAELDSCKKIMRKCKTEKAKKLVKYAFALLGVIALVAVGLFILSAGGAFD